MTIEDLSTLVDGLVNDARNYRDSTLAPARLEAQRYYDGELPAPLDKKHGNRSKAVSLDVRATIKKVLPSIVRTILGNDKVVEYEPVAEGDEEKARQATLYINTVVLSECRGADLIGDAIHDALLLRNGILKWWFEEKAEIEESEHSGLSEVELAILANDADVELLEHSAKRAALGDQGQIAELHDVRIRRQIVNRRPKVACIPLDEFLIDSAALEIDAAQLVGTVTRQTRSDLIAMGLDRDVVESAAKSVREDETSLRRRDAEDINGATSPAMEQIDYYDLYVRVDFDGDGIAELRHICAVGEVAKDTIVTNEIWDEAPFADLVCERRPHQWVGQSIAEDVIPIQDIKTALLRGTLDNLYWANNAQPIFQEGTVQNPDALYKREFGLPIKLKQGSSVAEAIGWSQVPMFAKDSFAMLSYMDEVISDRTGINDAASGLAPDALQNMTARGAALIEQGGIGQVEQIVRTMANGGLKRFFRGLLKLIIQHQDKPRTIRLRNQWVEFDPRSWNANMDCSVNTGLGAGTRERDMMMMQQILGVQEKLIAGFGPDNPFVKPDNLYNTIVKLLEAAGLKTPDQFITQPDAEEVKARLEAQGKAPSPEQIMVQAQMELEKLKGQIDIQKFQAQMQMETAREGAQMQADLQVKQAEMQKAERAEAQRIAWEREKFAAELALEREKLDRADIRRFEADRAAAYGRGLG